MAGLSSYFNAKLQTASFSHVRNDSQEIHYRAIGIWNSISLGYDVIRSSELERYLHNDIGEVARWQCYPVTLERGYRAFLRFLEISLETYPRPVRSREFDFELIHNSEIREQRQEFSLHHHCETLIVHSDLKPSNVLPNMIWSDMLVILGW